MKDSIFLVYDENGIQKTPKTTQGVTQGPGVYVKKVTLHVPDEVFEREIPEVTVEVPADDAQPTQAEIVYDNDDICTVEPVEFPGKASEPYRSLFRCPECGAEKETSGDPFGIHYKPDEDEEADS